MIGDFYKAVTGLPNPDEVHAIHMSRFADQNLIGMKELMRELEKSIQQHHLHNNDNSNDDDTTTGSTK